MVYICSECGENFDAIKSIIHHYRYFHRLGPLDRCKCCQPGCVRFFNTLHALETHLSSHVNDVDVVENVPVIINDEFMIFDENDDIAVPLNINGDIVNDNVHNPAEIPPVNLEEFVSAVSASALGLIAKLYSQPDLPRNHIQSIIDYTNNFLGGGFLPLLKEKVRSFLTDQQFLELQGFFKILENPFVGLETEHQRFKAFSDHDMLVKPEPFQVKVVDGVVNVDGHAELEPKSCDGQFLPMRSVLQKFLEQPGVFDKIMTNMENLEADKEFLKDFLQGEIWQHTKEHFTGKIVFPLFLHSDSYEPDNLTGSHSGEHSMDALYFTLPGIPKEYQGSLRNIFIASLCLCKDKTGNNVVFDKVLDELDFLATEGIILRLKSPDGYYDQRVYFSLQLVIGDNKGIHEILGFMPGFNANFYCRLCKTHRDVARYQVCENDVLLRTVENYDEDVEFDTPEVTGIKEKCVFNDVAGYHCIRNPSVDLMHDVLEGVCCYGVSHCLYYFVIEREYLTDAMLRDSIKFFDYGPEQNNKPPFSKLTSDRIRSLSLNLSASEMLCLVRYLGLMIGNYIPENDEVWLYFLKLQEIVDFVMSPVFYPGWAIYFQSIVQAHHEMYILYFNDNLKPKHHLMLHYWRLISLHGPPVHVWSMLLERKHRESKRYARVCLNRINLPYSIMLKHSLELCYMFLSGVGFRKDILIFGDIIFLENLYCYKDIERSVIDLDPHSLCTVSNKFVSIHGTRYNSNCVLLYGTENDYPAFAAAHLFLFIDNDVYFVMRKLVTIEKNSHINAYLVRDCDQLICMKHSDLLSYHVLHVRKFHGENFVTPRHVV